MKLLVIGTVASITFKFSDADVSPLFRKTKGTHLIYFVTNKGYSSLKLSVLLQVYILQRIKHKKSRIRVVIPYAPTGICHSLE